MKSELVQSALIIFNDWTSQQFNLYDNGSTVEVEWSVGPIPIEDKIGKNIIIRYDTDIINRIIHLPCIRRSCHQL
jgi:lysosomal alpha-mannosidase